MAEAERGMSETEEMRRIETQVREHCAREQLFLAATSEHPLPVAAAVSGGADSMALLLILKKLAPSLHLQLFACHVNHCLRGQASDRDEVFVRAECARLGVPLRVFSARDVANEIPSHAGEDWARSVRYLCFDRLFEEGISLVATAHTVTDQAETLLFRLARGTGLHGAGGIRPGRDRFVRPLLMLQRTETERYCTLAGQSWVTDESNLSDDYARNRLRHYALPALAAANSAAERNLGRFCEKAARIDEYLSDKAQQLLEQAAQAAESSPQSRTAEAVYALSVLQAADFLILEYAIHKLVSPVRDAEEKYIRLLCELVQQGSGAVQLRPEVRFCAGKGLLWKENDQSVSERLPISEQEQAFSTQIDREYHMETGFVLRSWIKEKPFCEKTQVVHKKDLKNQADYAKIAVSYPALVLRTRRSGDRFRPAGRGLSKEVRKLMNEAGIPPALRDRLPLLAAGGEVIWMYGFGFADGLAPETDCQTVLELKAWQP